MKDDRLDKKDKNYSKSVREIIERIKYLISLSRLTQGNFARRINMDPANLSKILSGSLKMSDVFVNRVVVELGVSKKWLLYGEGVPFDKHPDIHIEELFPEDGIVNPYKAKGTPVYDIDVTAGFNEIAPLFTRENIIGFMDFPKLDTKSSMVRVSGDSMVPVINDGAFIAIHPVPTDGIISWGQIYVVIMKDYRLLKYIKKNPDPSKITLHSANPAYEDIDIDRKDVLGLYIVDAVINYKLM